MTRDDWRNVEPILTRALLLRETEQKALIDSAALNNLVRGEIMDLLRMTKAMPRGVADGSVVTREADSAGSAAPLMALASGETLDGGRFVIVRQIGRGGMGTVYLAQDTTLGTLVALKVVPADDRLMHEAQRAAACSGHDHVAMVHNVLRTDVAGKRVGVLVMDYIAGRPASRIVEDGPVEPERALKWIRQAAAAVAHAHDCEVLHCDLKPANIIVTADDRVKVLDFGIARASFEARNPGEPVRGTLAYMAPEQLLAGEFSRASDVYSLGATLFELLTGRPPFTGDTPILRLAIVAAPPPKVSEFVPGAPAGLDAVMERALAKNTRDRFRSARAFARAIEELHPTKPVEVSSISTDPPRPRFGWMWTYGAGLLGLGLTLSVIFGLIACRAFEVVLRVDSEFSASVADYFRVGREALLPIVIIWVPAAATAGIVAAFALMVRWRAKHRWDEWGRWWTRLDPRAAAVGVLVAGTAAWLVLTWNYRELFIALLELHQNPATASVAAISGASRSDHLAYANLSSSLSFLLLLAGFVWLPRMGRRCADPATIQLLSGATLVVAVIVMLGPSVPRRFLFERFRVVDYAGQRALEIGRTASDLVLYDTRRRVTLRVRRDAPSLRTMEETSLIFPE